MDLNQCPLCVGGYGVNTTGQGYIVDVENSCESERRHIYLDRKLHALLNDPEVLEEIIVRYDDASAG